MLVASRMLLLRCYMNSDVIICPTAIEHIARDRL